MAGWDASSGERDITASEAVAVSCRLLHALIDERELRRGHEVAAAIDDFPLPAAVLGRGRGREPLINSAWRSALGEADALPAMIAKAVETARTTRATQQLPVVAVPRRGYVAYLAALLQPLHSTAGVLATCSEITDAVLTSQLGASGDVLVWCATLDGVQSYIGTRWRKVVARDLDDALHRADLPRWRSAYRRATREGPVEIDVRLAVGDGQRWFRVRLVPAGTYVVCCASDVHERYRRETDRDELVAQARRARAEAERANQLKNIFLTAVSHELRTPLTTMMLWEKVLREHCSDDDSRNQALDAIHDSAIAQERLIADLLDFARTSSGRLHLDIRDVDLDVLTAGAVEEVRPRAQQKSIDLAYRSVSDDTVVPADAERVRQILAKLLSNAIKFTPANGRVTVQLSRRADKAHIEIADTGRGIAPDLLAKIFEAFGQVDERLTRREGGLGLGLTMAKQLAELHRGTLVAASEGAGKGATFTLTLPVARSERAPAPGSIPRPARRLDGARVLVVDDDAQVRRALAVLLGRLGALVDTADSAPSARDRIEKVEPDVVICDIAMPGEDGYSLIRSLRERGSAIGSIALTAFSTEIDTRRALDAGFDVHLTKPLTLDRLLDVLSGLLAAAHARAPRPRIT